MNNYEYIIASLPNIQVDSSQNLDTDCIIEEIKEQLSSNDLNLFEFFLSGYQADNMNADFYIKALQSRCRFIREYFSFDLGLRNCKVTYLNDALERPAGTDVLVLDPDKDNPPFEYEDEIMSIFSGRDIVKREKALDDKMWEVIDDLAAMEVFSLDLILSFVAKIKIIDRWLKLDAETGKAYFRQLVNEIRATYDNKKKQQI